MIHITNIAPGGYEIAWVDDFDMPEHMSMMLGHVKIVYPCYFIATRTGEYLLSNRYICVV